MTAPPERRSTVRDALQKALEAGPATARELSREVGVSEKEIADHLEHLARSLEGEGRRLLIEPAECIACGYVFEDRRRFETPSRCPECQSERIEPPVFHVPAVEEADDSGDG